MEGVIFQYDKKTNKETALDVLISDAVHKHIEKTKVKPNAVYYHVSHGNTARDWKELDGITTKGVIWIFPYEIYVGVE